MAIDKRKAVVSMARLCLGLLVAASCGFPRPKDVGGDDGTGDAPGPTNCQVTAIEQPIANTGDTITIEGTFVDTVAVNFPGGTSVDATVLGLHRATATVPASASEGDLTVTACGSTLGPLRFRRASFAPALGRFSAAYDQTNGGHQSPTLITARSGHTSTVTGHHVYVVGGVGSDGALDNVEQARTNADGTLGPFESVPGMSLVTARQAHTATILGSYLYVVGGFSNGSLSSVERASIAPDGSLGPFTTVVDAALTTARQGHASAVVGNFLYILGGFGGSALNTVERAIINSDSSLGPFMVVPNVNLTTARHGHATAIIGGYLYVVGGTGSSGPLQDVERATIGADGSLGSFAPVPAARLTSARSGHTTLAIGNYLYALGGLADNNSLASVERAPLAADGSVGAFAPAPDVIFTTARHGHSTSVIGNYLYVLGGTGTAPLNSVEHATLNAGGSLDSFEVDTGAPLNVGRADHTTAVTGNHLYVIGGFLFGVGTQTTVERATIHDDGSLGPFENFEVTALGGDENQTTAILRNYLYLIGGAGNQNIERVSINPDGSLGASALVSGAKLVETREAPTCAVLANYLYVLGGFGNNGWLTSVERAPVNADGSLGGFMTVSGTNLVTGREGHTNTVIGAYLYVIGGGVGTGPLNSVERATINADGSLGAFAQVPGVTLVTARRFHTSAVVGGYLYVLGGRGPAGDLDSIERAPINPDNSLGAFATVPALNLTTTRFGHTTAILENYVYAIGGFVLSGSQYSNNAIRARLN